MLYDCYKVTVAGHGDLIQVEADTEVEAATRAAEKSGKGEYECGEEGWKEYFKDSSLYSVGVSIKEKW